VKKKLAIITQTTTPYNDALFDALSADPALEVSVYVMRPERSEHPWKSQWKTAYRQRAFRRVLGVDWELVSEVMQSPGFVLSNSWFDPTALIICCASPLRPGLKFGFWTDTPVEGGRAQSGLRRWIRRSVLGTAYRSCRCVFGMGPRTGPILAREGLPPEKYVDLPCYIDLGTYAPAPLWDGKSEPVFLAAGRLDDKLKGYSAVIRAFAAARLQAPVQPVLEIAGTGPDEASLRRLAIELGVTDRVRFLGWLEPHEVKAALARATVFVHGAYFEPFGVVILEAMASGLAVLSSDGTMAGLERVIPGKNGYIHAAGDTAQLTAQMAELLNDAGKVRAMQTEALATSQRWPMSRGVATVRDVVMED